MASASTSTGPNLTDITYIGRQSVKYGLTALVVLIVGRTLLTAFVAYWKATHPEPPPPPTVGFGILPSVNFSGVKVVEKPTSYVLETPSGTLPVFGDRAKVFLMPKAALSLLADETAKSKASEYDFVFSPTVIDSRTYRWSKSQPLESTLQMDLATFNFEFSTNYLSRPDLIGQGSLPDDFAAVTQVKNFLKESDLLPADVATASGEVVYLKSLGGELQPAVSYSDADFIQVDLNRTPIDNLHRMFTEEGYVGTTHAILGGALEGADGIMELQYRYHPIDYTQMHTYPLRTTDSAWRLLQAGEGIIINPGQNPGQAVIRQVELGYFDSFEEQEYLQPVFVFTGDGDFMAMVPALDPQYVQTQTQ